MNEYLSLSLLFINSLYLVLIQVANYAKVYVQNAKNTGLASKNKYTNTL
jgi:hypothetical protein